MSLSRSPLWRSLVIRVSFDHFSLIYLFCFIIEVLTLIVTIFTILSRSTNILRMLFGLYWVYGELSKITHGIDCVVCICFCWHGIMVRLWRYRYAYGKIMKRTTVQIVFFFFLDNTIVWRLWPVRGQSGHGSTTRVDKGIRIVQWLAIGRSR